MFIGQRQSLIVLLSISNMMCWIGLSDSCMGEVRWNCSEYLLCWGLYYALACLLALSRSSKTDFELVGNKANKVGEGIILLQVTAGM